MLNFFRQKGLANLFYGVIIVGTICTFVIEFRPNAGAKNASLSETCVARIRGRCIDPKDFGSAYRILMPAPSSQLSRRLSLRRIALDGLIERELLDDEAKRLGITVSDEEVTDELYNGFVRVSVPAADPSAAQAVLQEMYQSYARGGRISRESAMAHIDERDTAIPVDFRDAKTKKFDIKAYERQVRMLSNRSTTEFREEQAREILAAKMRDIVREPIRVSDAESWQEYDRRTSTASLTWILVKEGWAARWLIDAKPSELDAWAKDHQAEVEKAVQERMSDDAPKAGHLRHVLVKTPYGASDEEKSLAIAKVSWAASRIRAGEAFAEVARDLSEDTGSAIKGGDVGDKTDGFVAPFRVAAEALKPGEATQGAVETQFGYHLIMRDDPAQASEIEAQVKRGVPRTLLSKARASDAAREVAQRIVGAMRAGKTPEDAVTEVTAAYGRLDKPAAPVRILKLAAENGSAADAGVDASSGGRATEKPPSLELEHPGLPEKPFGAASDPDRPQVQTSAAFNRGGDPFPGLTPEGTATVVAFAFSSKDGDAMAEPVRTPDGYVAVVLKQRKEATRADFDKDRDAIQEDMVRSKRDEALALYVKRLREEAKAAIKVDESYVQEASVDGGAGGGGADEDEDQY